MERLAVKREGEGGAEAKDAGADRLEVGTGKQQTLDSQRRLERLREEHLDAASLVKLSGDDRENRRRVEEEETRQELRGKLLAEAEQSAQRNAGVAIRWADLFQYDVPQELDSEIQKQREACDKIIESKDQLILELRGQLKLKDDEYVKALKRQAEDVELLLGKLGQQFSMMQGAYAEELEAIEAAFLQQRQEILAGNKNEMNALFERRNHLEQNFMEKMLELAEEYQRKLEELRVLDAEDFNILKIRLETDIQNLEQHLEAIRATYQLNTEKLEYNYRVLVERDQENQSTINQQKRKIARQRDLLSSLKSKYSDSDRRAQDENSRLTEEYRRITEQFKELKIKFRHFQTSDTKRYREVWAMNEEKVAALVRQVLQADKIIHSQQLGVEWCPPGRETFEQPLASAEEALREAEAEVFEAAGVGGSEAGGFGAGGARGGTQQMRQLRDRLAGPNFEGLRRLLLDEARFLLPEAGRDAFAEDEALEGILGALGVSDVAGMDALQAALAKDGELEGAAAGAAGDAAAGGQELVGPDEAVQRLKAFVQSGTAASASAAAGGSKAARVTAFRRKEREKQHWERMSNVIDAKMFRVWGALEKKLDTFHGMLGAREKSLRETHALGRQNKELRTLLNQYLSANINKQLQVPPTQII